MPHLGGHDAGEQGFGRSSTVCVLPSLAPHLTPLPTSSPRGLTSSCGGQLWAVERGLGGREELDENPKESARGRTPVASNPSSFSSWDVALVLKDGEASLSASVVGICSRSSGREEGEGRSKGSCRE